MAFMPGATYIGPTPNKRVDGMVEVRGLVLHIQQGTEQGSEAWFKNPASQASSHFLNPKMGSLRQLVDTKDRAWA
ncbi:MAG: N-acetylmuramoyl-L-alanine amidase, partial [Gaiellaceae bacterium]